MYNFYQSKIRKHIQKIYGHEIFEIRLWGKSYQWIIKKKKILGRTFEWLQVLWITLNDDETKIKDAIRHIKQHCKTRQWVIFFQLWLINTLTVIKEPNHIDQKKALTIWKTRLQMNKRLKWLWLYRTIRENMPPSTIVCSTSQTEDELFAKLSSQAKRYVRKAKKRWVICKEINLEDRTDLNIFWTKRNEISNIKWFHTITKTQFQWLIDYFKTEKTWKIRVALYEWEIIAGWIYLYDKIKKQVIYLYWFAQRNWIAKNLWAHYRLKQNIRLDAKKQWFEALDLFGWSPTWDKNHSLLAVSKFKESLWWEKIEYYGSFDVIVNPILYHIFKTIKKVIWFLR